MHRILRLLLLSVLMAYCSACVGFMVGQATDAAIAVGKVPFKVGGAVIDAASPDDDDDKKE